MSECAQLMFNLGRMVGYDGVVDPADVQLFANSSPPISNCTSLTALAFVDRYFLDLREQEQAAGNRGAYLQRAFSDPDHPLSQIHFKVLGGVNDRIHGYEALRNSAASLAGGLFLLAGGIGYCGRSRAVLRGLALVIGIGGGCAALVGALAQFGAVSNRETYEKYVN